MIEVMEFEVKEPAEAVSWALKNPGKYTLTMIENWTRQNRVLARLELPNWDANILLTTSSYSKLVPGSN